MHSPNERISEILNGFKIFDGIYKKKLVDAAIELQEEITPGLIDILIGVSSDPGRYMENDIYYDHIYAVMLLGHFREYRAHKVIVDLFSLLDNIPYKLFGDITTSDLPVILLRTCGGSVERIKSMALNKTADDYCRISALSAMAYAIVENIMAREDVLDFYGSLFRGNETNPDSNFWGLLANLVCDVYPEKLMDTIKASYENGLISPGMIGYKEFERELRGGKEKCMEKLKIDLARHSLDDIHASMSWWACFQQEDESVPSSVVEPFGIAARTKMNPAKKKAKRKRKIAKASRKKSRR